MRKSLIIFYQDSLKNFGEAVINLFIFLPYFFSINSLLKTFFYPWRNLSLRKHESGFSWSSLVDRLSFNFISSFIGALMRFMILFFYIFFQAILMIMLPFIALVYFFLIPVFYVDYLWQKTEEEKKDSKRKNFIKKHMLDAVNSGAVSRWFDYHYQKTFENKSWWSTKNLFSIPPLARDWAVGYTPTLDKFSNDLATPSYLFHMKNIVGRSKEIHEIETLLAKEEKANLIIVGEEGVGKHTIIDAVAKRIFVGNTNVNLIYKRILKLNMEKILNEYVDGEQRENFFETLIKEAFDAGNIILFIDNFDRYVNFGPSLEKYILSNRLSVIGTTTPALFEKTVFQNEKINKLFEKVEVVETTKAESIDILENAALTFEKNEQISIPYESIIEVVEKSDYYITYIPFPEKAVDLLDKSCVLTKSRGRNLVTPKDVDDALSAESRIPILIDEKIKNKLISLEKILGESIFDQEEAISALSASLRRAFLLLGKRKKPLASFLFLGPTGVGKTELAKSLGRIFFDEDDKKLIRFDMSLYQTSRDIDKLLGDSDYHEPGLLSSAIRENPYGVLLLDELEKANKNLLNIFLTIFDEGYFTDSTGKRVDCKNLFIVATSNAASKYIYEQAGNINESQVIDYVLEKNIFSPEFINRFDGVVVFKKLEKNALRKIAFKLSRNIIDDIAKAYKMDISVSDKTIEEIVEKDCDLRFGARDLDRKIRQAIEDKIAKILLDPTHQEEKKINL